MVQAKQSDPWQESIEYLARMVKCGDITDRLAMKTGVILAYLSVTVEGLPAPDQDIGPDGETFASWDHGEHHFSLEVETDETIDLFYRNRTTGRIWGEGGIDLAILGDEALARLRLAGGLENAG